MANNIIDKIQVSGTVYTLSAQTEGGGVPESAFTAYTASTNERISQDEEVTAAGLNALNDKITPTVELTQAQYDALVSAGTVSADTYYIITDATAFDPSTKVDTSAFTAYSAATNTALNNKVDTSAFTAYSAATNTALNNKVDKSAVVSSVTSASTDSQIPTAKAVWEVASGGGTTYTAGRGISIANDTISFNLPISAGTGSNSIAEGDHTLASGIYGSHAEGYHTKATGWGAHAEGNNTTASGNYSHAEGDQAVASGKYSHAEGFGTAASNLFEHASGQYNVSRKASTTFGDSGNTLFSVGNGTSSSARHNAFEIRQNGDIYLSLNGQDVKLQDQLGGGSVTVDTALDSGSTNPVENRVIYNKIDEVEQVTAAGLNAVNDKFDGLKLKKLTQAEYDALSGSTDANTLYVIVN